MGDNPSRNLFEPPRKVNKEKLNGSIGIKTETERNEQMKTTRAAEIRSQRPPKPAPVPLVAAVPKSDVQAAQDDYMGRDLSMSSAASRDHLRRDLQKRRGTLTREECQFLERLIIEGDEIEVSMAHETLLNSDLFFEPEGSSSFKDESDRAWMSERGVRIGQEISGSLNSSHSGELGMDLSNNSRDSIRSLPDNMGSSKRREQLEQRKKTQTLSRLWFAHANGLAVSKKSSRRSLLARQISSGSGRIADLHARSETDAIFRKGNRKSSDELSASDSGSRGFLKAPMDDVRSDNYRSRRASFSHPAKAGGTRSPRRSSLRLPAKPTLRRFQSDVSRKSVSFKDLRSAQRVLSDGSLPPIPPRTSERSSSISSIPSIHHAHPVRSPSNASVASLHRAHPIRSDSMSTACFENDLDSNYEGRSSGDEKKVDPSLDWEVPYEVFRQDQGDNEDEAKCIEAATKLLSPEQSLARPVAVRRASRSSYHGEGFEVAQLDLSQAMESSLSRSSIAAARRMESLVSFGNADESTLPSAFSFDEGISVGRFSNIFRRRIERSLSDENLAGIFLGGSRHYMHESSSVKDVNPAENDDDDRSWNLDEESTLNYYDAWKVIEDEYENGYGGGGALPFKILGTSGDDIDSHPHVLSPPLMESLASFVPTNIAGHNFWMKYSLVRDGASVHTFLQHARGARFAILALETIDGEVFGCFTTEPWRKNWNFFGGEESFLWRMRHSRKEKCHSIIDQAHMESEIDVYPFAGLNNHIQLCTHDKIAIGGGTDAPVEGDANSGSPIKEHDWGYGLALDSNLLTGTSSPSVTFGSPSLSKEHSDGSPFEIVNLELWTMTPCMVLEEAEKLELGLLFLRKHGQ